MNTADEDVSVLLAMRDSCTAYAISLPPEPQAWELVIPDRGRPATSDPLLLRALDADEARQTDEWLRRCGYPQPAYWQEVSADWLETLRDAGAASFCDGRLWVRAPEAPAVGVPRAFIVPTANA